MPKDKKRKLWEGLVGMLHHGIRIPQIIPKVLHISAWPVRTAMPTEVETIDTITSVIQSGRHDVITPAMFPKGMKEQDYGSGLTRYVAAKIEVQAVLCP
jgi:hypothetical protein